MDIFTKCYQHSFVDELRERDLFPYFRELQSRQDTEVITNTAPAAAAAACSTAR